MTTKQLVKPTKCLSVRQPWAHLIFSGGKDVENRTRRTHYRGTIAIHASSTMRKGLVHEMCLDPDKLIKRAIIGTVDLVDCVKNSKSKWADKGKWHWILKNPRRLKKAVPMDGRLGLFPLEDRISRRIQQIRKVDRSRDSLTAS